MGEKTILWVRKDLTHTAWAKVLKFFCLIFRLWLSQSKYHFSGVTPEHFPPSTGSMVRLLSSICKTISHLMDFKRFLHILHRETTENNPSIFFNSIYILLQTYTEELSESIKMLLKNGGREPTFLTKSKTTMINFSKRTFQQQRIPDNGTISINYYNNFIPKKIFN